MMKCLVLIGFFFFSSFSYCYGQIDFKVISKDNSPYQNCVGDTITFVVKNLGNQKVIDSLAFFISTDTNQFKPSNSWLNVKGHYELNITLFSGKYNPILAIYRNGIRSNYLLDQPIYIYKNPDAYFKIIKNDSSCNSQNTLCLQDSSTLENNSNSLVDFTIDWGNGFKTISTKRENCHIYGKNELFRIKYSVTDSKGCKSTFESNNKIKINNPTRFKIKTNKQNLDSALQTQAIQFDFDSLTFRRDSSYSGRLQVVTFSKNNNDIDTSLVINKVFSNRTLRSEKLQIKLKPGKYNLKIIINRNQQCDVYSSSELRVGNFMKTRIDEYGFIYDSIYYYHASGSVLCDSINWTENLCCIDTNGFFYNPDSNALRKYWYKESSNYNGPKIKEAIFYDFNSDGVIDSMRPKTKYTNWDLNSRLAAVRIPRQYQQDTLTVWSRDSLGQWQSSNPIPYTNCSYFKRHDYFNFTKYNGECQFSSDGKYKIEDTLHVKIRKLSFNGNDTSYTNYDAFSFQANSEIFKPLDYGHYVIERVTNNGICDAPIYDTVVSCAGFNEIIEDSVFQDSLSIFNGFSSKSDSILIEVIDTLNNWVVIDSAWLGSEKQYLNVFPNGNYFVGYYSNTLDCGYERMWNLHNSSIADDRQNSVKIFPNPTSHIVNVVIPVETGSYRLFDFTGREVKSGILNKGVNKLVLSELPKGVYIMEINSGNEIINFSTIKD